MTPPIHDREQATKTVRRVLYPHGDEFAEQIVDALGIGQPDRQVADLQQRIAQLERLRRNAKEMEDLHWDKTTIEAELGQERHICSRLGEALTKMRERAERAEERLRAVTEPAEALCKRTDEIEQFTDLPFDRVFVLELERLRAVLSVMSDG